MFIFFVHFIDKYFIYLINNSLIPQFKQMISFVQPEAYDKYMFLWRYTLNV